MIISSVGPSAIPYKLAMKKVPAARPIGDENLNSDTAMGNTSPVTLAERPRVSVAANVAGKDARDDRVVNPIT